MTDDDHVLTSAKFDAMWHEFQNKQTVHEAEKFLSNPRLYDSFRKVEQGDAWLIIGVGHVAYDLSTGHKLADQIVGLLPSVKLHRSEFLPDGECYVLDSTSISQWLAAD